MGSAGKPIKPPAVPPTWAQTNELHFAGKSPGLSQTGGDVLVLAGEEWRDNLVVPHGREVDEAIETPLHEAVDHHFKVISRLVVGFDPGDDGRMAQDVADLVKHVERARVGMADDRRPQSHDPGASGAVTYDQVRSAQLRAFGDDACAAARADDDIAIIKRRPQSAQDFRPLHHGLRPDLRINTHEVAA